MRKKLLDKIIYEINRHPLSYAFTLWKMYVNMNDNYRDIAYRYGYWYHREKRSQEPIYFIFRFHLPEIGIGTAAKYMVFLYDWAMANNVIPIIDLEHKSIFKEGKIGVCNIWEYCFEQPMPIKKVLEQKNVFVSNLDINLIREGFCLEINGNFSDRAIHFKEDNEYYARIWNKTKTLFKLNKMLQDTVDRFYKQRIEGHIVLGVALREEFSLEHDKGMDAYMTEMYKHHPKIPNLAESIKIVKMYYEKWGCDRIFVSTLYEESIDEFQKCFGDNVIYLPRKRRKLSEENAFASKIHENSGNNSPCNEYFLSKEFYDITCSYVEEIFILSRCNSFIGTPTSVSAIASVINRGQYKHYHFFNDENNVSKY